MGGCCFFSKADKNEYSSLIQYVGRKWLLQFSAGVAASALFKPPAATTPFAPPALTIECSLCSSRCWFYVGALKRLSDDKGITNIASETGLGSENLCKALLSEGNPEFTTVIRILQVLGLRLQIVPIT